jgi:exosortase
MLGYWLSFHFGLVLYPSEYLAWIIFGFYLSFVGVCLLCFARETLRDLVFPIGFLVFIVPFPSWLTDQITTFLQLAFAIAAHLFFTLSGMPVFRQDLVFQLPGMRLEVAPECSGIHSTLVLFITSLLAGQLFLRRPWSRAVLAISVIPLCIL